MFDNEWDNFHNEESSGDTKQGWKYKFKKSIPQLGPTGKLHSFLMKLT